MLLFIFTFGGLLLMMGHQTRGEALFYYFRLEDQVPENHLLRLVDRHVNLDFIRAKLNNAYSDLGRPSIDPELLLRMLLVGYLYGVTSERKLVEELRMHLAWRWFTGLGFDQEIPHHSTFSKNRHGRFQESNLFQEVFEEIVARCVEVGLVKGEHMSVDGSFIQANADHHSRVAPEQLAEVAKVNGTVREYLAELEQKNPVESPAPTAREGLDHGPRFDLRDQRWSSAARLLRQLSGGQRQLHHRRCASYAGAIKSGECSGPRHDRTIWRTVWLSAADSGGGYYLRQR